MAKSSMPGNKQTKRWSTRACRGFTLLEVLVALTIAALALGLLLTVIGGNKRLAWRGEDALLEASRLRAQINLVRLEDGRGEIPMEGSEANIDVQLDLLLEDPERLTVDSPQALRGFEVTDEDGRVRGRGSYWVVEEPLR